MLYKLNLEKKDEPNEFFELNSERVKWIASQIIIIKKKNNNNRSVLIQINNIYIYIYVIFVYRLNIFVMVYMYEIMEQLVCVVYNKIIVY